MIDPIAKLLGSWSASITIGAICLRLGLTLVFSAILGCERASKRHSAGLRTFMVVALASTLAGMIDMFLIESYALTVSKYSTSRSSSNFFRCLSVRFSLFFSHIYFVLESFSYFLFSLHEASLLLTLSRAVLQFDITWNLSTVVIALGKAL